jgi:disulfide bond formation protein DsbB
MLEAEAVSVGGEIFHESCTACHGASGMGMAGAGKNLVYSDFVAEKDDNALAAFIKRGRDPADPANTTGIGMPPKGGNPTLTDQDLLDVVAFLRSLQDPRRVPEMTDNASASTGGTTIKN